MPDEMYLSNAALGAHVRTFGTAFRNGDPMLVRQVHAMLARGEAFQAECKRRGVRFLPKQVMRPVYAKAGIAEGKVIRLRLNDFYAVPPAV